MKKLKFLSTIIFISLSICITHNSIAAEVKKDKEIAYTAEQEIILAQINNYRNTHHLPPLLMNKLICEQAKNHSFDMATNKIPFGHDGFKERMERCFQGFSYPERFAENVAFTGYDAKSVVNLWLNSPGHRKNIEGDFNLTGIGIARDENNMIYVTQIFIRAKDDH